MFLRRIPFLQVLLASFVALSFLCAGAQAAGTTGNLNWTNPTTYIDNTNLPAADIASSTITWYRPGVFTPINTLVVTGSVTTAVVNGLACGSYEFTIKTTTKATAFYPNVTSAETNRVTYNTGIPCAPNTATGVTVS